MYFEYSRNITYFEAEVFDQCDGHPDQRGRYHYHQISSCVYGGSNMDFIGVALDGHPIYGPKNRRGVELTSSSSALDECHGMYLNTGLSKEAIVCEIF